MARRPTPAAFEKAQGRFRAKRFRAVQGMVNRLIEKHGEIRILDAGGRAEYWNMLETASGSKAHITVLNYGAELADYSDRVAPHVRFENVTGDACNMPQYSDNSFHLAHANSVIEHVGSFQNMVAFAQEIARVSESYYVQTPNYWFPIDPHNAVPFLHWMPDPIRFKVVTSIKTGLHHKTDFRDAAKRLDHCRMVSSGMMRNLFPDARHSAERFGLIFKKSLIAIRD